MKEFWAGRTARERVLVCALAIAVAAWLGVAGLWQPLQAHNAALIAQMSRLQAVAAILANTGPVITPTDTRPLPIILTDSAASLGLTIRRLQPDQEQVQVILEDASFDAVLVWIDALTTDHGLSLLSLDLTRRPAPGVVATTLTVAP